MSLRPTRSLLVILLLTFAVFAPSLSNGFAMDDAPLAQSIDQDGKPDEVIAGWRTPWWYFGQRYWEGTRNASVLYRPATVLSYAWTYNAICAPLLGPKHEAFPHHLINVLLHCFAVFLVWWMVRDLGLPELSALACAGVFAIDAIHSEVVAGIVGRAELFSFVFGLWGTLLFVRGRTIFAGLLLALAFFSKESALAWAAFLPCYLIARNWSRGENATVGAVFAARGLPMAIVLGVALVVFFGLRTYALWGFAGGETFSWDQNPLAHVDTGTRLLTAVKLLGYGLLKCVAPFWLYALYGPGAITFVTSAGDPGFLAAVFVLGAWLVAGLLFARTLPLLFLSVAAFLGFSFITSNVPLTIGTIFGERLFYMPSLGVCMLPILLLNRFDGLGRKIVVGILIAWGGVNAAVILDRNRAWQDSFTLFVGDAERLTDSADLQAKAGYMHLGTNTDKALYYFERCVRLDPEFAATWSSIARIHQDRGDLKKAADNYERALGTRYIAASGVEDRTIEDYLQVLVRSDRLSEACALSKQVIARKPKHYIARLTLVDQCGKDFGPKERLGLILDGLKHHQNDSHLLLLKAMVMYETIDVRNANANARIAFEINHALGGVRRHVLSPEAWIKSQLYLGDTLASIGRKTDAQKVYQRLLEEKGLSADLRARVRTMVRELGNE